MSYDLNTVNTVAWNRNYLIIDGKNSYDFNLYISGGGTYSSPEKNVEEVEVPGLNGALIFEEGEEGQSYKNVELTYRAFIFPDFNQHFRKLKSFLLTRKGYVRLEDTYHPDEYRLASFKSAITPDMHQTLYTGEFDLTFNCKPQRFLKYGENPVTFTSLTGIIKNETDFIAKPLIRAYGTGTFTVNGRSIKIVTSSTYTDIDCETMNAYKDTTNCNSNIQLQTNNQFPVLGPGENSVSMSSIPRLEITPRWWTL